MKSATIKYAGKVVTINSLTDNDNMLINYFQKGVFYEQRLLQKVQSLNLNGTYLDVGANIGNHAVFFGTYCPSDKVIAIEAEKSIYGVLTENMKINFGEKKYQTYNNAISDFDGKVSMTPIRDYNVGGTHVIEGGGDVDCTTLDVLVGDEENITLIKMDIEGHELRALKMASKIIENNYPVIITEAHERSEFSAIKEELTKYGYTTDGINYANTPTYFWVKK